MKISGETNRHTMPFPFNYEKPSEKQRQNTSAFISIGSTSSSISFKKKLKKHRRVKEHECIADAVETHSFPLKHLSINLYTPSPTQKRKTQA